MHLQQNMIAPLQLKETENSKKEMKTKIGPGKKSQHHSNQNGNRTLGKGF